MIHELKIWPKYFRDIWTGRKLFEVRKQERDYRYGDRLVLKEFDLYLNSFTGNVITAEITYILDDKDFVTPGFVILGIKVLSKLAGARFLHEIVHGEKAYSVFMCGWCRWRFVGDCTWIGPGNLTKQMEVPNFCPVCGARFDKDVMTEAQQDAV